MRIAVALLAAVSISAFALAQEPAPSFPVVNDLPEGWDMGGADMPVDILGVKIGMPREQAVATISSELPIDPTTIVESAQEKGIADQYGTQVFFKYVYWWNAWTPQGGASRDYVQLSFSTGISGERVTGIQRKTEWSSEKPRVAAIEAALTTKYGPPTYSSDLGGGKVFAWGYFQGQKFQIDEATARRLDATPDAPGCLWNFLTVPTYDYEPEPMPGSAQGRRHFESLKKDCNVVMTVTISYDSDSPGLVRSMETLMAGPKRIYENFLATDVFLDKALEEAVGNASGGPAAPKL